jgi:hypothetical protein
MPTMMNARVIAAIACLMLLGAATPRAGAEICCLPEGTCVEVPPSICEMLGGIDFGAGTCAGITCIPFGPCCMPDLSCMLMPEADCVAAGGFFQGLGPSCSISCPVTGACCFADGSCGVGTQPDCLGAGGTYLGFGTTCAVGTCLGACCVDLEGTCADMTAPVDCESVGGSFLGAGQECIDFACPAEAQCLSYAFAQNNIDPLDPDVILPFARFDTAGGTRVLRRVYLAAGTVILAVVELTNEGTMALDTDLERTESSVVQIPAAADIDPALDPYTDVMVMDVLSCAVTPLPPGETCNYGGLLELDSDRTVMFEDGVDDLSGFEGAGTNDVIVTAAGMFSFIGQLFDLSNLVHRVEGTVKVIYEYSVAGACCFPGALCEVLTQDECEATGGTYQGDLITCAIAECEERDHPGWNWVDNGIVLTANEPAYWSSLTGFPKGVSPFTVLDPGGPLDPGRPATDGTDDRVLRGYLVAWAVDQWGAEIKFNHISGAGTVVNYRDTTAWEYSAFSYGLVDPGVLHGTASGTPGDLHLDGLEYAPSPASLLLNFQAAQSSGFSAGPAGFTVVSDGELTLHPVNVDVRANNDGPITTDAQVFIWNENEHKFSGTHRCVTCWDQTLLSRYDTPNNFLRVFLQTEHGKARIGGFAADVCDVPDDPATPEDESVTSVDAPLLSVAARLLAINGGAARAAAGTTVHGVGEDPSGLIRYDVTGGPPPLGGAPGAPAMDRASATEKGSLLIFPKIELRWDRTGALVQDTFISITNDFPEDVRIKLYFINGDPPLISGP